MRGRRYKVSKSLLIITDLEDESHNNHKNTENTSSNLIKAASNILGVDAVYFQNLNVKHLAPGSHPGRLVLFTESAFNRFKEKLESAVNQ